MKVEKVEADKMEVGEAKLEAEKVEMEKVMKMEADETKVCQSCCPNVIQED